MDCLVRGRADLNFRGLIVEIAWVGWDWGLILIGGGAGVLGSVMNDDKPMPYTMW